MRDGLKCRSGRMLRAERLVLVVMMAMVERCAESGDVFVMCLGQRCEGKHR